jgi:CheY-like chemotaxis protein
MTEPSERSDADRLIRDATDLCEGERIVRFEQCRVIKIRGPARRESDLLPPTVALVEEVVQVRTLMRALLAADHRITVAFESATITEALAALAQVPVSVVILDQRSHVDVQAGHAAKLIRTASPTTRVIVWDGFDLRSRLPGQPWVDAFVNRRHPDRLLSTVQALLHLPANPAG